MIFSNLTSTQILSYAHYDGIDDEAVEDDPNIVNDFDYGIDLFPQLDDDQPDDPLEVAEVTEVVEAPIEPMEVEAEPQIDLKKCVGNWDFFIDAINALVVPMLLFFQPTKKYFVKLTL